MRMAGVVENIVVPGPNLALKSQQSYKFDQRLELCNLAQQISLYGNIC